nr:uncharacterized protein LOC123764961 [Procambarus clarkii]
MVSVVSSLLSHTLWRVVGADPHHHDGPKQPHSSKQHLPTADTTLSHACGTTRRLLGHTEGRSLQAVTEHLWEKGGGELYCGCEATHKDKRPDNLRLPLEAKVDVIDPCDAWVVLDAPFSPRDGMPRPALPPLLPSSARTSTVNVSPTAISSPPAPSPALEWWQSCFAPSDSSVAPACVEVPSPVPLCASPRREVSQETTNSKVGDLATDSQIDQELSSSSNDHGIICRQMDKELTNYQENQKMIRYDAYQEEISSNSFLGKRSDDIRGIVCPDLPRSFTGRSRGSAPGSRKIATLGSPGSRADRWRWRRQCPHRSRSEDILSVMRRRSASSCDADTMNPSTHSGIDDITETTTSIQPGARALPPENQPRSFNYIYKPMAERSNVGLVEGKHLRNSVSYREDIRAFDIYKITKPIGPGEYSRLPSPPAQSDPEIKEVTVTHDGLRNRKRRSTEHRKPGEKKRYREDEEDATMALEATTLLLPSPLQLQESLSTTVTKAINTVPRPSSSSSTSNVPPHSSPITTTTKTTTPTVTGKKDEEDVGSDDTTSDANDDDDEASTVVPEDFSDETDSDIEVLAQSESWVDLSDQPGSPDRVTPLPFGNGEEYLRLLREAQRESNQSSARVSLSSSRRDTPRDSPHDSPKSPPNSPNTEMTTEPEEAILKGVYINYYNKEGDFIRVEKNTETDWIWDWSSRPDQTPPKEWRFSHPRKGVSRGASIRRVMVGNSSLFSRDVLYTLLITNVLSLLIGTGIGIWLSKRSGVEIVTSLPIN